MGLFNIDFEKMNYKPKSLGKVSSKKKKKASKLLVEVFVVGINPKKK